MALLTPLGTFSTDDACLLLEREVIKGPLHTYEAPQTQVDMSKQTLIDSIAQRHYSQRVELAHPPKQTQQEGAHQSSGD